MKTGEGKTLVSTLPVYLNALSERGVHVVTVNDYLATRDSQWMGQLHNFLGITVGRVGPDITDTAEKQAAYALRRDVRHEHRVRLRLPARQHGEVEGPDGPAGPRLRDRRRGRLDPHRRGTDAAHHLGSLGRARRSSTTSSLRSRGSLSRDADYEVDEEKRTVAPTEEGIAKVEGDPRRLQPLRPCRGELRPPADPGADGQGAVPPRQGLPRRRRRGEDRRRVHRPHPRGSPLGTTASTRPSRPRSACRSRTRTTPGRR